MVRVINHANPDLLVPRNVVRAIAGPVCPVPGRYDIDPVVTNLGAVEAVILNVMAVIEEYRVCVPSPVDAVFDLQNVSNAMLEQFFVPPIV